MFHTFRRSILLSPCPSVFSFQEYLAGRNPQKISLQEPWGAVALFANCHICFSGASVKCCPRTWKNTFASEVLHLFFRSIWQEQASRRSLRTLGMSHFVCKLLYLFFGSIWQEQMSKRSLRILGMSHSVCKLSHLFFRSIWQEQARKRSPRPSGNSRFVCKLSHLFFRSI